MARYLCAVRVIIIDCFWGSNMKSLKEVDWSKAPEGATHYNEVCTSPWLKDTPASYFSEDSGGWIKYSSDDRSRYEDHFNSAVKRQQDWDGEEMSDHDDVNNPKHYDLFPNQQVIDVIQASLTEEEFAGYCKGNALKYRLRAGDKGDALKCIAKANWYQNKLREVK